MEPRSYKPLEVCRGSSLFTCGPAHLSTEERSTGWGASSQKTQGSWDWELLLCLVPGAPALSLELGGEKASQGSVHQENDYGNPRLRLRLQRGRWGDHTRGCGVFCIAACGQSCRRKGRSSSDFLQVPTDLALNPTQHQAQRSLPHKSNNWGVEDTGTGEGTEAGGPGRVSHRSGGVEGSGKESVGKRVTWHQAP